MLVSTEEDRNIAWELIKNDEELMNKISGIGYWLGNTYADMDDKLDEILGVDSDTLYNELIRSDRVVNLELVSINIKRIINAK